ncbi:hypothetical protein [Yoonia sp. R2-816]|uniref:hypothetical protein n=1 Tax=Yoonia sp. R2-816 TaxID=3342638 RepID=UPI00372A11FB
MTEEELTAIYDAAWKNAPPSVGMDILADHLGSDLMDQLGDYPRDLATPNANLTALVTYLAEEVLRLAINYELAPFDGSLAKHLQDGDTEQDWLEREDLLPFVMNWSANVRGML